MGCTEFSGGTGVRAEDHDAGGADSLVHDV
jgi:hypothetical protein